jgi:hypothetical protein
LNKILFHGFEKTDKKYGWGDVIGYISACYVRAKLLKFKEMDIVFPRFDTQSMYCLDDSLSVCQDINIDGINLLPNNLPVDTSKYSRVVDTTKDDSLYVGFKGIYQGSDHSLLYNAIVYRQNSILPVFDTPQNKSNYILFHIRNYYPNENIESLRYIDYNKYLKKQRNSNIRQIRRLLKYIKGIYGDKYKYICIGDDSPINHLFDQYIKPNYILNDSIDLIKNCSMLICPMSGIGEYAYHFKDVPILHTDVVKKYNLYIPEGIRNKPKIESIAYLFNKYPNWCDNRLIMFFENEILETDKLDNFLERHLEVPCYDNIL